MTCTVRIRENASGIERDYSEPYEWSEFMWTDGNYGCDCNRRMFWQRAGGEEPDEDPPCGRGAYTAVSVTLEDGTVLPIDDV